MPIRAKNPNNYRPGVLPDARYPDTEAGWRRRILDGDPIEGDPARLHLDPDELLDMAGFAEELTALRHPPEPYKVQTIRFYKQIGNLPVPTVQKGGHWPVPGETIPVNGQTQHTAGHKIRKTRLPREGEKIGCREVRWPRWMIWQWESQRRGPGRGSFGRKSGPPFRKQKEAAEAK